MIIDILFYIFGFISIFSFLVSFLFLFIEFYSCFFSFNGIWVFFSYFTCLVSITVWVFSFPIFVYLGGVI